MTTELAMQRSTGFTVETSNEISDSQIVDEFLGSIIAEDARRELEPFGLAQVA